MTRKHFALAAIVLVIVLMAGELISWTFFSLYGKDRLRVNQKLDADALLVEATTQKMAPVRKEFKHKTLTPRPSPANWQDSVVSAYGDSFTYCSQVADNETWPFYLAETVHTNVVNYGQPGFGPDEAVLKLEDNLQEGKRTNTIILAVLSENIGRVISSFPVLFFLDKRNLYFKPIILDGPDGALRWERSYLNNLDTEQGKRFAVEITKKHDFWYAYNKDRLLFEFPYLLLSFKTAYYLAFKHKNWGDLWSMDRPVSVMREIVMRFYRLSRQYKFRPVLVFIPAQIDTIRLEKNEPLTYSKFVSSLRMDPKLNGLQIIDIGAEFPSNFAPRQFNVQPHSGHASAAGNRVIADAIARHLQK